VAAGGAALSAGAGAVASAASAFFSSVSGSGEGASSGAPTGGPRPPSSTGTRPKRKVILAYIFKPCFMYALILLQALFRSLEFDKVFLSGGAFRF
jgi:hypothetical protein